MRKEVRKIINEISSDENINYSDYESLYQKGLLNSIRVLQLILMLEKTYNIKIDQYDIELADFECVKNITDYISKIRESQNAK